MYYNTCPHCGASLDPGEKCDCENVQQSAKKEQPHAKEAVQKKNDLGANAPYFPRFHYIKNPSVSQLF